MDSPLTNSLPFSLYLISDRTQCSGRSLVEALVQACQAGVRGVQLREKDLTPADFLRLARDVRAALDPFHPALLINDRADVARAVEASGVHLPESGLPPAAARQCLRPGSLIGVSTHSVDSACRAQDAGADFITFGPVFFTPSKASYGPPLGLDALEQTVRTVRLPVFAIGGITPERARSCLDAGAHGVAVISAILAAPDIPGAVAAFRETMGKI